MKLPKPTAIQLDFLKPEKIGKLNAVGTVNFTGNVKPAGKGVEFSDIIAEVKFKGKLYGMGIAFDKPNYTRLVERFGDDSAKWKGAVKVKVLKNMGRLYLAIA